MQSLQQQEREFPNRPPKGVWPKITLLAVAISLSILATEIGARIFLRQSLALDEKCLMYRYDAQLGWFPVPGTSNRITGSRLFNVTHNSSGFRGREPAKDNRPRLVFLGDSFVWGFDVEASDRFTDQLQQRHPEWAVCNLGVSGYGTDQEYLLLQQRIDNYNPTVVFLTFCADNDHADNAKNVIDGGFFKPYYKLDGRKLTLSGIPVPRCERAFWADHKVLCRSYLVRLIARAYYRLTGPQPVSNPDPTAELILAMRKFGTEKGSLFAVGVQGPQPPLEKFFEECRIPYVDLTFGSNVFWRYGSFGGHWTPEGHRAVCDRVEALLTNLLASADNSLQTVRPDDSTTNALTRFYLRSAVGLSVAGNTEWAIRYYRQALELNPDLPEALNNLAWTLATHPDPRFRDGPRAVRLAQRACELTGQSQPIMLAVLAAAYAEAGRFAEAVQAAEQSVKLAQVKGESELAEKNRRLLQIYQRGMPHHEPPQITQSPARKK